MIMTKHKYVATSSTTATHSRIAKLHIRFDSVHMHVVLSHWWLWQRRRRRPIAAAAVVVSSRFYSSLLTFVFISFHLRTQTKQNIIIDAIDIYPNICDALWSVLFGVKMNNCYSQRWYCSLCFSQTFTLRAFLHHIQYRLWNKWKKCELCTFQRVWRNEADTTRSSIISS